MIQKANTIVTEEELEQKTQETATSEKVPFTVTDPKVSEEETPKVEGGYPTEQYPKVSEDTLKEIGSAAATKEMSQNSELNNVKFDNLVKKNSSRALLKIKSAKLLDFFPDEIVIETTKINISLRDYFFMRRLHTISIEDISDIFVETTPFYATLKIVDKDFIENSVEVPFLKKDDAKRARRLIQGLVTAYKEGVDLTSLPDEGLVAKLEVLGSAGEVENISP
jgi:hypothetical protein